MANRDIEATRITIRGLQAISPASQHTEWFAQAESVLGINCLPDAAHFLITEDRLTVALDILHALSRHRYSPSVVAAASAKEAWLKSVASTPAEFSNTAELEKRIVASPMPYA